MTVADALKAADTKTLEGVEINEMAQLLKLTNRMIQLSDRLDGKRLPYAYRVLAGSVRDSAYDIRNKINTAGGRV